MSCVAVFFIGNSIENGLLQTGAFEIYFNGKLKYILRYIGIIVFHVNFLYEFFIVFVLNFQSFCTKF